MASAVHDRTRALGPAAPRWRLIPLLLLSCFFLACAAPGVAEGQPVPENLLIELRSGPNMPRGDMGPETTTIHGDGGVDLSARDSFEGPLPASRREIGADALGRITAAIEENDFFALKPEYEDPDIDDGDYAVLRITMGERSHAVTTVNIRVNAFDRIVTAINREMPEDRWVIYNALHIDEYKEVER